MEYTEETALKFVKDILVKNEFKELEHNIYTKGKYVMVFIKEDYYVVSHYDAGFLEWMDWHSPDRTIYSLLGYLSYHEYIERGYKI